MNDWCTSLSNQALTLTLKSCGHWSHATEQGGYLWEYIETLSHQWLMLRHVTGRTDHLLLWHVLVAGYVQGGLLPHPGHPQAGNVQGQRTLGHSKLIGGFADEEVARFEEMGGIDLADLGVGACGYNGAANHAMASSCLGMYRLLVVEQVVSIVDQLIYRTWNTYS